MIRRLVWAGLGATIGISAYRRISRRLAALTRIGRGSRPGAPSVPQAAAAFLADVREGRAEYLARYPADPAPNSSRSQSGSDYVKDGQ